MEAGLRERIDTPASPGRFSRPDRLRVALVHDWLTGLRGGEKCLEVLCRAFPEATLHTLIHKPGSVGPTIDAMTIRTSPLQRVPGVFRHYRKLLPLMPLASRSWNVGSVDLVISLSHCVAKAVRVPEGVPHVCYCFTPMRYAWEGRAAYFDGKEQKSLRRLAVGWTLDRLRDWDRATASRVNHFIAISQTVRERISRCYDRESRVIEPPVDTEFFSPANVMRNGPYLCVSALVPYKRIDHAITACSRANRELIVIGAGPDRERLESLAGPSVRFLGWQPDEVVRDHYRRARALLFPGEEDFGIVPLEAMACGCPLIALGRGGAAETVVEGAGVLYEEPTPEGLLSAIERWEAAGRPHHADLARLRAEQYATSVFRSRMLDFLAEVVADSPAPISPPAPHMTVGRGNLPQRAQRTQREERNGKR